MFGREPKPIRQLRYDLEVLPMMWKLHEKMPVASQHHAEEATRSDIRSHTQAALATGHEQLARQVLEQALRSQPDGHQPSGLRWQDIVDTAMSELPSP